MLHVLTTLLATALLACSTGANALKENKERLTNEKFSLRKEPKRAYYDPAETYGTNASTVYNYSSNYDLKKFNSSTGTTELVDEGGSYIYTNGYSYQGISGYTSIGLSPVPESNEMVFDVYLNGLLEQDNTKVFLEFSYPSTYSLVIKVGNSSPLPYIWIFDHQEPDPIEEMNENIFDAVGDTITGLSDALTKPWDGILNIFYDTTENEVTQMGYLVLIGLGVSITLLVFWTILRLFRQRN